jgi:branched-chain amino acid transport system substrate-binding protein
MAAKGYKRRLLSAVAVSGAALLIAACSSGSGSSGSSGSAASDTTVVIGAPYPLSGTWAQNGINSLEGMQLAADQINAAGGLTGLNGAKIKIVSADTSSDNPGQARSVTEQLISNDHAVALVGSYLSSLTLATVVAANRDHVPLITQSFVSQLTSSGYKYIFQIPPTAGALGNATVVDLVKVMKSSGQTVTTVTNINGNDASSVSQGAGFVAAAKANGLSVVGDVHYPDGLSSATAIVNKVLGEHPQAIGLAGALPDVALIIKGLRQAGVTAPIISEGGGGALTNQFSTTLGQYAQGMLSVSAWNWDLPYPGIAAAEAAYKAKYHQDMPQETGESWVAVNQIAQAINNTHSADPVTIRNQLAQDQFTSGPASAVYPGKVAYEPNGLNKYSTPLLVQWNGGVLRTVYPPAVATTKVISAG